MHPVFHVSLLKKKVGNNAAVSSSLLIMDYCGRVKVNPVVILDIKIIKKDNQTVVIRQPLFSASNLLPFSYTLISIELTIEAIIVITT
jgi:hypothetical protein